MHPELCIFIFIRPYFHALWVSFLTARVPLYQFTLVRVRLFYRERKRRKREVVVTKHKKRRLENKRFGIVIASISVVMQCAFFISEYALSASRLSSCNAGVAGFAG